VAIGGSGAVERGGLLLDQVRATELTLRYDELDILA
jgi:hypothetical protein